MPAPATPTQVTALVAGSDKIQTVPQKLQPGLVLAGSDIAPAYFPGTADGCPVLSRCAFGAIRSHRTMVLFGDSHALMWLPALARVAKAADVRLLLAWMPSCPAADVAVWDASTRSVNVECSSFRSATLEAIDKLGPALVLIADRTSDVPGSGNRPIPDTLWERGEALTIESLLRPRTRVAVIGDITAFTDSPIACVAAHPRDVQACSVPNPNPKTHQHVAAELEAANEEGVPYINPQPWLCTSVCSPIVGNLVVYFDSEHVTATYAEFLTEVWADAIDTLLAH